MNLHHAVKRALKIACFTILAAHLQGEPAAAIHHIIPGPATALWQAFTHNFVTARRLDAVTLNGMTAAA